jgi:iron complex transport system substrate-binding protein
MTMKPAPLLIFVLILTSFLPAVRVITLAPALTETVFFLGRGSEIVGRTKFCDHPAPARSIPEVGGLWDPNLEAIIRLEPDLVILYPESSDRLKPLKGRMQLLVVPHRDLADIFFSIRTIAAALGIPERGERMAVDLENRVRSVTERRSLKAKIPTLLIAGRNPSELRNITLIGRSDFINELLELAGGVNAYQGDVPYPTVSMESILGMNPSLIIEFSVYFENVSREKVLELWDAFPRLEAVRTNHIHIVTDPMWVRPGPRIDRVARGLFQLLHGGRAEGNKGP